MANILDKIMKKNLSEDKQLFIAISLIEAFYVIYMLNYFKTRYSLAHPFSYFENKFLYHPIGKAENPICNICPLGNYGSYLIVAFIIIRLLIFSISDNNLLLGNVRLMSKIVLSLVFLLSLLNFNAVVYLIPYFILEVYLIKKVF